MNVRMRRRRILRLYRRRYKTRAIVIKLYFHSQSLWGLYGIWYLVKFQVSELYRSIISYIINIVKENIKGQRNLFLVYFIKTNLTFFCTANAHKQIYYVTSHISVRKLCFNHLD